MVMQTLRAGASNKVMKFVLFGILLMATLGLVMTDVGGFFQSGGVSRNDVARIGHEKITISTFDRTLRRTLGRLGIGVNEAYKLGYVNQLAASETRNHIMAQAAHANDLALSRKHIATQINNLLQPMIGPGQDAKTVLQQVLANQGISEAELTDSISRDTAVSLLTTAVQNGTAVLTEKTAHDFYMALNEMRDVEYVVFADKDVKEIPAATDEILQKVYEGTKEIYAIPESREIQIIRVKDEALKKTLEITNEELQHAYDNNIDTYNTPAQRSLEQVIVRTKETAQKIYDSAKGGSLEKAAKDAGQLSAYNAQDIEETKIAPEISKQVLAAKQGDLLEPFETPLGWHVISVKKITAAYTKPFADVKNEIKDELYETRLVDQKYTLANEVDDLLASGASVEEIASKVDLDITNLASINSFGLGLDNKDALTKFENIRSTLLDNAFKLGEGETSPVSEMPDGNFMAVHIKKVTLKTYKPFEEVRTEITNNYERDMRASQNRLNVTNYLTALTEGKKTIQDIASESGKTVKTAIKLTRKTEAAKPLTPEAITAIFAVDQSTPVYITTDEGAGIAIVKNITWPEKVDDKSADYSKFKTALLQDMQSEAVMAYIDNKGRKLKAAMNTELLERAYGQQNANQ